jgi:hypothetical protein
LFRLLSKVCMFASNIAHHSIMIYKKIIAM